MNGKYQIKKSQVDYVLNNNPCSNCNKKKTECGGCELEKEFNNNMTEIPYDVVEYCSAITSIPEIEKELEYYNLMLKINKRILNLYEVIDDINTI